MLNAPGWSVSCCNRSPSSRERRFNSRPSQPAPRPAATELSERIDFEEPNSEAGLPSGISMGSDSPKRTESRLSSIPIKSRMTLRVMRCQNDSLSSIAAELGLKGPYVASSPVFSATEPLVICSTQAVLGAVSGRWLLTLALLRLVSLSISSNMTLDCSILHCSILSLVPASMLAASRSSIASILFCTLDLLLWCPGPIDRFRGLKRSKCHNCS